MGSRWSANRARSSSTAALMGAGAASSASSGCRDEWSSSIGLGLARDLPYRVIHEADGLRVEQHRAALAHFVGCGQRALWITHLGEADKAVGADHLLVFGFGRPVRRVVVVVL